MCMKGIGGPNHNLTVWLVPRCDTQLSPALALAMQCGGGILMTIHGIYNMSKTFCMY